MSTVSIRAALTAMTGGDFRDTSTGLLAALAYGSERVPTDQPVSVSNFIAQYPAPKPGTQSELAFADSARSVRILFQVTDSEIASVTQQTLSDDAGFSTGNIYSFLFVAVELKGENYTRG